MNVRAFLADTQGSVATLFAYSVVPLTLIAGFSVDYGRVVQERNRALAVIDAAALGAVRETASPDDWEDTVNATIAAHEVSFTEGSLSYSYTADPPTMTITGHVEIETSVLGIMGMETLSMPIHTTATRVPGMLDVDIAFAFDATGSMNGLVTGIKQNLSNFHEDLAAELQTRGIVLGSLRVRPTVFRDLLVDGSNAMLEADFFDLPAESDGLDDFLEPVYAGGGGDQPESGLVALRRALESNWRDPEDGVRRVVVVWTDAPGQSFTSSDETYRSDSDYERCYANARNNRERRRCRNGGTTYAQALETIYDLYADFHDANIAASAGVESMLIVNERRHLCPWSGYYGSHYDNQDGAHSYCWPWENQMENWNGVAYRYYNSNSSSANAVYAELIERVADTLVVGESPRIAS